MTAACAQLLMFATYGQRPGEPGPRPDAAGRAARWSSGPRPTGRCGPTSGPPTCRSSSSCSARRPSTPGSAARGLAPVPGPDPGRLAAEPDGHDPAAHRRAHPGGDGDRDAVGFPAAALSGPAGPHRPESGRGPGSGPRPHDHLESIAPGRRGERVRDLGHWRRAGHQRREIHPAGGGQRDRPRVASFIRRDMAMVSPLRRAHRRAEAGPVAARESRPAPPGRPAWTMVIAASTASSVPATSNAASTSSPACSGMPPARRTGPPPGGGAAAESRPTTRPRRPPAGAGSASARSARSRSPRRSGRAADGERSRRAGPRRAARAGRRRHRTVRRAAGTAATSAEAEEFAEATVGDAVPGEPHLRHRFRYPRRHCGQVSSGMAGSMATRWPRRGPPASTPRSRGRVRAGVPTARRRSRRRPTSAGQSRR